MEMFMQDGALATLLVQRASSTHLGEAPQQGLRQALQERGKAAAAAAQGEEAALAPRKGALRFGSTGSFFVGEV